MDHAGWQVAGGLLLLIAGAFVGRLLTPRNDCAKCGILELKAEIRRLCNLVKVLAERVQLSVKEQLEIEQME
jgi:hypothetical protein